MNSTSNRERNNLFAILPWEKENARLELGILDCVILQEPASHKVHGCFAIAKGTVRIRKTYAQIRLVKGTIICQPLIFVEGCFHVSIGKFDSASCALLCPIWSIAEHICGENPFQCERCGPTAIPCAHHLNWLDTGSLKLLHHILEIGPSLGNFHSDLLE